MANVKKGQFTSPPQWWNHLKDYKRLFWNREKNAGKKEIRKQLDDI